MGHARQAERSKSGQDQLSTHFTDEYRWTQMVRWPETSDSRFQPLAALRGHMLGGALTQFQICVNLRHLRILSRSTML
jgi:hypothetical protein